MFSFGSGRVCGRARDVARAVLSALLILSPPSVLAQPATGGVTVAVVGDDGRLIAGAVVTLRGDRSVRSFQTFAGGVAEQTNLAPGVYVVSVAAAGFAPLGGRTIEVRAGQTTDIRIDLVRSSTSLVVLGHLTTHACEALST